jgi:hypothetical protein
MEDLRRFPPLTQETFDAAEIGGRTALHGFVARASVNSDFRPLLDLNGERLRFRHDYASETEDLGEARLDIPAAIEDRRRGFSTLDFNPTPQIRRSAALVEARQLREMLAGRSSVPATDSLHAKLIQLREFLLRSSGSSPVADWTNWLGDFVNAESLVHGGTAGVADEGFYGRIRQFVVAAKAPAGVIATTNFYHGLASWDFAEAARASAVLLEENREGRHWIPTAPLRQGTMLARIKVGDLAGARAAYHELQPDSPTVTDQVLLGVLDDRPPQR